jgi:hypothetical protein
MWETYTERVAEQEDKPLLDIDSLWPFADRDIKNQSFRVG